MALQISCLLLVLWSFSLPLPAQRQALPQDPARQQSSGLRQTDRPSSSDALEESWQTFDRLLRTQEESIQTLEAGLRSTESLRRQLSQNCGDLRSYAAQLESETRKRDVALMEAWRDTAEAEKRASRYLRLLILTWSLVAAIVAALAMMWYIRRKTAAIL